MACVNKGEDPQGREAVIYDPHQAVNMVSL